MASKRRDLARERLKEIRTIQGWREAYKVAGLTEEGTDATKRRRLSRLINTETSGYKKIEGKQRAKINRAYRRPRRQKALIKGRSQRAIASINKEKRQNRKRAAELFGRNGTFPNPGKLAALNRQNADLTEAQKEQIRNAFDTAEQTKDFMEARASYASALSSIDSEENDALRSTEQRKQFRRKLEKAENAAQRDQRKITDF